MVYRGRSFNSSYRGLPRGSSRPQWDSRNGSSYQSSTPRGGYRSNFDSRSDRQAPGGSPRFWNNDGNQYQSSYDSRSRFDEGGRFSARKDDTFKRPHRDSSGYDGRNHSPDRKRGRADFDTRSIRSSERNQYDSNDYNNRYDTPNRFTNERRFNAERRSFRETRDDYRMASPQPLMRGVARGARRGTGRGIARGERPIRRTLVARNEPTVRRRVLSARRGRASIVRRSDRPMSLRAKIMRGLRVKRRSENTRATVSRRTRGNSADDADDKKDGDDENKTDDEANKSGSEKDDGEKKDGGKFKRVPLRCPHCRVNVRSFKDYRIHLTGVKHRHSMKQVSHRLRQTLAAMRIRQRAKQRYLDSKDEDATTNFCLICKLNYKQSADDHKETTAHKQLKRFLMPSCRTCKKPFRSSMAYEGHLASIEHLKAINVAHDDEKSDDDTFDLNNFLTLDSVGDVDDDTCENKSIKSENEENDDEKKDEVDEKTVEKAESPQDVNVGLDQIRAVTVLYCNLCKKYLSSGLNTLTDDRIEKIKKSHCRNRVHLKHYIKKEDTSLRETAEKIYRKNQTSVKEEPTEKMETNENSPMKSNTDVESPLKAAKVNETDEKDLADIDKDLGEILREVADDEVPSSDDEGDRERYGRFKTTDSVEEKDGKPDEANGDDENVQN